MLDKSHTQCGTDILGCLRLLIHSSTNVLFFVLFQSFGTNQCLCFWLTMTGKTFANKGYKKAFVSRKKDKTGLKSYDIQI